MKRTVLALALGAGLLATGCGSTPDQQTQTQARPDERQQQPDAVTEAVPAQRRESAAESKPAPPRIISIPEGTPVQIRTAGVISTKSATQGSTFEATLAQPLVVGGRTVAAKGAGVTGVVAHSDSGGRVKGTASIGLALKSIELASGEVLPIRTGTLTLRAGSTKKKDALKVGIGSGIGAAIGAIAGGGSGAAIGAGAGAAAGTGLVLATKGKAAEVPAESVLTFKLSAPAQVKQANRA